jgi:Domain of Unknown Function (DUF1080)
MRYLTWAAATACLLALAGDAARGDGADKDAATFFNGKDLTGWDGLKGYWAVEDGAIVGRTPEDPGFNTFLCSRRPYEDFELSFKVRLKGGVGNSGVQVRSGVFDLEHLAVLGPQCDIGQQYWASLYGEHFGGMMKEAPRDVVKKVLKPDDFNDYFIRCAGKHVTIKLNGETTVDGDFPTMPETGLIAWQLHSGFKGMEVTFKDIKFTEIKKKR